MYLPPGHPRAFAHSPHPVIPLVSPLACRFLPTEAIIGAYRAFKFSHWHPFMGLVKET